METTTETMTPTTESIASTATAAARSFAQQTPGEQAFTLFVFGMGLVVSGAFAYYLVTDPSKLTDIWQWTRSLHILVQLVLWLLFLPWMAALWLWALPWALPIRLVLVVGTLLFTNWLLWPWK